MEYKDELKDFLKANDNLEDSTTFDDIRDDVMIVANELTSRSAGNAAFLLVFAEWCGHCTKFKPEFVKLYKLIKKWNEQQEKLDKSPGKISVMFEKITAERKKLKQGKVYKPFMIFAMNIDDKENSKFVDLQGVQGVPSLFFISSGGNVVPYKASRSHAQIFEDLMKNRVLKKAYF
jgi:thiol-disulfide isomerase/thioredoxin